MTDEPKLKDEARQLIAFYDKRGWDWTSALGFILTRGMFQTGFRIHPIEGYRCYPYPKKRS